MEKASGMADKLFFHSSLLRRAQPQCQMAIMPLTQNTVPISIEIVTTVQKGKLFVISCVRLCGSITRTSRN